MAVPILVKNNKTVGWSHTLPPRPITPITEQMMQVNGPMNQFDVERIRQDFPILSTLMCGKLLAYLDNGATTQKPRAVIDTICKF